MQVNKVIQVLLLALLMLFSMVAISMLLEVRDNTRNIILGAGAFILLLALAWRGVPIDGKLLFIIILGYALGGKGFAYVSPFEPIYIGEISLALCLLFFVTRPKQMSLFDTPIHKFIWLYVIYAGIHLIIDYSNYRLMAIRDSSMAYYSLFFVTAFSLFHNERVVDVFERIIKIAIGLAVLSMVYHISRVGIVVTGFAPHTDAYIPVCVGFVVYFLIIGVERRKLHFIAMACIVGLALVAIKTAALMALIAAAGCAILFGGITKLIMPAVLLAALGAVVMAIMAFVDLNLAVNMVAGGGTAETLGIQGGEFVGFSGTTQWRWLWWTIIYNDTMQMAPFWGQGFGADITGPFLEAWLGQGYGDATGYARYPHNVVMTVFGRLGLIGLIVFCMMFIAVLSFILKFCRSFFPSPQRRDADLICFSIVVAGIVNGILQATYEIPHSAITHWVCLAYLVARYYGVITDRNPKPQLGPEKRADDSQP